MCPSAKSRKRLETKYKETSKQGGTKRLLAFSIWDQKKKEVHQMARRNKTTGGFIRIGSCIHFNSFQLCISSL